MRGVLTALFLTLAFASTARAEPVLSVGQMWTFRDQPSERTRLVIGRIEGDSIHVSILFIPRPPNYPYDMPELTIGHMPFDRKAINASVVQLVVGKHDAAPEFEDGYAEWRKAKGGVFTITVSDAIETVLGVVSDAKKNSER